MDSHPWTLTVKIPSPPSVSKTGDVPQWRTTNPSPLVTVFSGGPFRISPEWWTEPWRRNRRSGGDRERSWKRATASLTATCSPPSRQSLTRTPQTPLMSVMRSGSRYSKLSMKTLIPGDHIVPLSSAQLVWPFLALCWPLDPTPSWPAARSDSGPAVEWPHGSGRLPAQWAARWRLLLGPERDGGLPDQTQPPVNHPLPWVQTGGLWILPQPQGETEWKRVDRHQD